MGELDNVIAESYGMQFIDLDCPNIIKLNIGSTSKGNQPKYYDFNSRMYIKEQFEYQGILWKDYMVEHLSSVISNQLYTNMKIVEQDIVRLSNGRTGCISKDFLEPGSTWIPMSRTACFEDAKNLYNSPSKVFTNIISYFESVGLDLTEYLTVMIVLDYLLGNEDRHYGNFGIIQQANGVLGVAPLFDFGLGLFEHESSYRIVNLYTAKSKMRGKPFCRDLSEAVDMLFDLGLGFLVKTIFKNIEIPSKELFPNELGYQYFVESFNDLKGRF